MRSVETPLLRSLLVVLACAVAFRAAAGTPVTVTLDRIANPNCKAFAQFSITAVSQAAPSDPVIVNGVDAAGTPVALTLVTSNVRAARSELRAMYNLLRDALELSQQGNLVSQRLYLENSNTCGDTYDIHGADVWEYQIELNGASQLQMKLITYGLQYPVDSYMLSFAPVASGSFARTFRDGVLYVDLQMGNTATLAANLNRAVGVVGNVRNGWPHIYFISSASELWDHHDEVPPGDAIYQDDPGTGTYLLMSLESR